MPRGIDEVEYDSALPERFDVVAIGDGIAGVSPALALAERGTSVTLCEKDQIAAEPQLGLLPRDGARSRENSPGDRKPADVAGDEQPHWW